MARVRSPNRDKAKEIYLNSKGLVNLKDIAEKLGLEDSQIRKWKSQDKRDDELKRALPKGKSNDTNKEQKKKEIKQDNLLKKENIYLDFNFIFCINSEFISSLPFLVSISIQFSLILIIFPTTFTPNVPVEIWQFLPKYFLTNSFVIIITPLLFFSLEIKALIIIRCCGKITNNKINMGMYIAIHTDIFNHISLLAY
ncbi:phage terminase small subunit-related protein [Tepidibacter aestuarii]|uniref:phage terminase small subunit-related protein n=1 Tax=Tepidibacter aestuarii TaxID=2925782 RepID=UPI0020C0B62C|nr:phage terminase small subunit-related protein [Tepidibacter aestuarii]CAH2213249.1 protein of unknown function [Tepidibacter aestuarii]